MPTIERARALGAMDGLAKAEQDYRDNTAPFEHMDDAGWEALCSNIEASLGELGVWGKLYGDGQDAVAVVSELDNPWAELPTDAERALFDTYVTAFHAVCGTVYGAIEAAVAAATAYAPS